MIEQNGKQRSPPAATMHNVKRLSSRVISLMELQSKLLKVDVKDGLHSLILPAALLLGGIVLGLSCLPLLTLTVAHALREWLVLSWAFAYLLGTLIALGSATVTTLIGWNLLRRRLNVFDRSSQEFRTNLTWLKSALKREGNPDRADDPIQ